MRAIILIALGLLAAPVADEEKKIDPPVVRIESPVGGWTNDRIVTLKGSVTGEGVERVRISVNGTDCTLPVSRGDDGGGGRFERKFVLSPGENAFRVTARNTAGRGEDAVTLHARAEAKDVRVTLTWDTPETDIDLWVDDPDGERCKYDHAETKLGGKLDVDVTDGFGPEVFTLARAKAGTYTVRVHFYDGGPPTRARVEVVLHEGTAREERRRAEAVLLDEDDQPQVLAFTVSGGAR
jgi:uncharacterized protein YfaP (DUF2135 family)